MLAALCAAPAAGPGCERSDSGPLPVSDLAGYWSGAFEILRDSIQVVLQLVETDSATLSGRISLPGRTVFGVPAITEQQGRDIRLEVPTLRSRFEGRFQSDPPSIRGDWVQMGGRFRLSLEPTTAPARPTRPQDPVPPYPYRVDSVRFEHSGGSVVLAGTLTIPKGDGPFPAAVLVSGSGPQDRDETLFGHRPFLVLADHLTRAGVAVLRYDDRGVAESTGDFGSATTEDFATDALAAVDFLFEHESIEPSRIGIIGHSEGGIVAPIAATRSDRVAFIVSLAGTGIAGRELLELQTRLILEASNVPAPLLALNQRVQRELLDKLLQTGSAEAARELAMQELENSWGGLPYAVVNALGLAAQVDRALDEQLKRVASPWLFFFLSFDPSTAFARVDVPVLALNGSLDLQVPPEPNLRRIREALEGGGNRDVTAIELGGLNHLFQTATTGLPSEYGGIEETMAPEVLRIVAEWINELEPGRASQRREP